MDNLTTIKHVKHTGDSGFKQLVSEGWVLLHVYSQTTEDRTRTDVYYVMGHEGPIEETESKMPEVLTKMAGYANKN